MTDNDPDFDYEPAINFAGIEPDETWTYRDTECHVYHIENPEYSDEPKYWGTYIFDDPNTDDKPEERICYELSEHSFESDRIKTTGPSWSDKDYDDPAEIVKDGVEHTVDHHRKNQYGEPIPEERQTDVDEDLELSDLLEDP